VRGAVGLGTPAVRPGAVGVARLAGVVPIPAQILEVAPGRHWDWRVGPVRMRHEVRPRPGGSEVRIELRAPPGLETIVARTYGPLIALLLGRLARVAEDDAAAATAA
jgi:hypothetical protein